VSSTVPVVSDSSATTSSTGVPEADAASTLTPDEAVAQLQALQPSLTTAGQIVITQLIQYINEMRPKKPNPVPTQVRFQVMLYRLLTNTINRLEGDFNPVWSAILSVFHSQREGVFSERYVFRHQDNITLAKTEREAFLRLLNLIKVTADPRGRQAALKQVDHERTLQYSLTEDGRRKILNYYKL